MRQKTQVISEEKIGLPRDTKTPFSLHFFKLAAFFSSGKRREFHVEFGRKQVDKQAMKWPGKPADDRSAPQICCSFYHCDMRRNDVGKREAQRIGMID